MDETKYPEHEKLKKISDKSQAIGEFLEKIQYTKGYRLCGYVEDDEDVDDDGWYPIHVSITDLLAEYFDIDLDKLEQEKRELLEEQRKRTESRPKRKYTK